MAEAIVPVATPSPAPEPEKKLSGGSLDRGIQPLSLFIYLLEFLFLKAKNSIFNIG